MDHNPANGGHELMIPHMASPGRALRDEGDGSEGDVGILAIQPQGAGGIRSSGNRPGERRGAWFQYGVLTCHQGTSVYRDRELNHAGTHGLHDLNVIGRSDREGWTRSRVKDDASATERSM
jgi:hypothetical protein